MTNLFLLKDDVNVIVIDWGGGSVGLYSQSAANTRLVGLEVAALINYLIVNKHLSIFLESSSHENDTTHIHSCSGVREKTKPYSLVFGSYQ